MSVLPEHRGRTITFRSKSATGTIPGVVDNVIWRGRMEGLVSYQVAKNYMDLISYQNQILKVDPSIPAVEDLDYFLITLDNGSAVVQTIVFANEWIEPGSFAVIQDMKKYVIDVYDAPDGDVREVIALLKTAGYKAVARTTT